MKIPFLTQGKSKAEEQREVKEARDYDHNERLVDLSIPANAQDDFNKMEQDKERADLIRWQQDLSYEATSFIYDIMGYYEDSDGNWTEDKESQPLANSLFIKRIKPLLKLGTSRNFMMTNYSDERVRRTLQRAAMKFTDLIYFHYKTFGIDKKDCGYLVEMYQQLIEPTVYRSLQNGERKFLTTQNKRIETFNEQQDQKKKGLMNL